MTDSSNKLATLVIAVAVGCGGLVSTEVFAQQKNVTVTGRVTAYTAPAAELKTISVNDIASAQPMPLPTIDIPPVGPMEGEVFSQSLGTPGFSPGNSGTGKMSPVTVPVEDAAEVESPLYELNGGIAPQEYGTANHPYTTARVDTSSNNVSKTYPYRAAGKLYFKIGSAGYVCSASLIKRGVIVTAAHCVAEFGKKKYYSNFQFVPAKYDSLAPYGTWNGEKAWVVTSYYDGTDPCAPDAKGVVCKNDVAVIRLAAKSSKYPGTNTGWLSYGWDGYGFTPKNLALINQLGYPTSHDSGNRMQRTDSQGFVDSSLAGNTVWGSRQTGGSSGGPEVVNLGILSTLSSDAPLGSEAEMNTVVGATSWGYTDKNVKQQGASPFLSSNIKTLVDSACSGNHPACSK